MRTAPLHPVRARWRSARPVPCRRPRRRPPTTIVVSAAMSLKSAFEEIGALYASVGRGPRPALNFGASGDLVAQIRGGAPVDVFAAAAAKDMDGLEAEGALLPGTRVDFAANEIVLVVPSASSSGVSSFADLAKPAHRPDRDRQPEDRPRRTLRRGGLRERGDRRRRASEARPRGKRPPGAGLRCAR